jgi:CheY-like chemotaxis protein
VRRLEQTAIRALSSQIAAHFNLKFIQREEPVPVKGEQDATPDHQQELDWLRKSYTAIDADVYQLVESVIKTSEPMLKHAGGWAEVNLPAGLPPVSGQTTTLRQILLNLLLAAADAAPNPRVTIQGKQAGRAIDLYFSTVLKEGISAPSRDSSEYLSLASSLADLAGGEVTRLPDLPGTSFTARLSLPANERITILFVDDNEDSLNLFKRSLDGTHFHFTGTHDPHKAVDLAIEYGARGIVLDIMLPEIDGWELLGRLRIHPRLSTIPVIISTILPHEQLALSLGAAGFLRKPVSREALLDLLSRLNL